jgi:hypothetical protein
MGSNKGRRAIQSRSLHREEMIPVHLDAVFVSREAHLFFCRAHRAWLLGEDG